MFNLSGGIMKYVSLLAVAALVLAGSAFGQAKPCEELKAEIQAKIEKNGVKVFTLEIVAADADVKEGKVVGTCEGSSKKIVYKRG
jgi:hypothetical protein